MIELFLGLLIASSYPHTPLVSDYQPFPAEVIIVCESEYVKFKSEPKGWSRDGGFLFYENDDYFTLKPNAKLKDFRPRLMRRGGNFE